MEGGRFEPSVPPARGTISLTMHHSGRHRAQCSARILARRARMRATSRSLAIPVAPCKSSMACKRLEQRTEHSPLKGALPTSSSSSLSEGSFSASFPVITPAPLMDVTCIEEFVILSGRFAGAALAASLLVAALITAFVSSAAVFSLGAEYLSLQHRLPMRAQYELNSHLSNVS